MTATTNRILYWTPRILSMAFIGYISLFALDVFAEGRGAWDTLVGLSVHLVPSLVLIAGLAVAWRWEWVGTALFGAAGLSYAWMVLSHPRPPLPIRIEWCLVVAGPALVIAALFAANWLLRGHLRGSQLA